MCGKERITRAEQACEQALDAWRAAHQALGTDVSVNGCGIIHDPHAFRQRLFEAKHHLTESLAALEGVDWPTDQDYDDRWS